jgi:hypothetical protein
MNRIQFWVLTGLSSVVVLFLILQVIFVRMAQYEQARVMAARQVIQEGQQCDVRLRQLAGRVYQLSQQTQDAGLKDLLTRQQITVTPPPASGDGSSTPSPEPMTTAPTTR